MRNQAKGSVTERTQKSLESLTREEQEQVRGQVGMLRGHEIQNQTAQGQMCCRASYGRLLEPLPHISTMQTSMKPFQLSWRSWSLAQSCDSPWLCKTLPRPQSSPPGFFCIIPKLFNPQVLHSSWVCEPRDWSGSRVTGSSVWKTEVRKQHSSSGQDPTLFLHFYSLKLNTHRVPLDEFSQIEYIHITGTQMKKQNVISTPKARLRPSPYAFTRVTTAPVREGFELNLQTYP